MARYLIRGADSTGRPVHIETMDYQSDAERDAEFARLRAPEAQGGSGFRLDAWKPLPTAATTTPAAAAAPPQTTPAAAPAPPPTTPTSTTGGATPGATQQPPAGPAPLSSIQPPGATQEQLGRQRASALGTTANIALSSVAPELPVVRGVIAGARASANPLIRTLGPATLRAGAQAAGGAAGGVAEGLIGGESWQNAATRGIDQGFKGAVGSLAGDVVLGGLGRAFNWLRSTIGVEMTAAQHRALATAVAEARQENRPFSITGYVMQAPEFANTPAREKIWKMAQLGGQRLAERAGVPQNRYAAAQADEALRMAGGPLEPQAQGVPGFGQDIRPMINEAVGRFENEAATAAAGTVRRPRAPQMNRRAATRDVLADPTLTPAQAQERMAAAGRIPNENALARQTAARQYQQELAQATQGLTAQRLDQIRDRTNIDLRTATQESIATALRGGENPAARVAALIQDVPELGPLVARAKLTDAIRTAGSPASDSFNPATFAAEIRTLGEHNFERVFGANAAPMQRLLSVLDTFVEGTKLARGRTAALTEKKPTWQIMAAVMAPAARIISGILGGATVGSAGAMALGAGSALGGGGGLLFGATTGAMTAAPEIYGRMLSNPGYLDTFTRLVEAAGTQSLTPQTAQQFVLQLVRNAVPQAAIRAGDIADAMGVQEPPSAIKRLSDTMSPASARY